jgi:quinol monooxygenase YgiN
MFARITWYKVPPDKMEAGIKAFDQWLPAVQAFDGYAGAALLVDRAAGEAVTVAYYQDRAALKTSAEKAGMIRQQATDQAGSSVVGVEEYEITLVDRAQPSASNVWARVITGTGRTDRLDEAVAAINDRGLPIMREQKGYRGFIAGANRETGKAITAAIFDTRDDLEASNAAMSEFRQQIREQGDVSDLKAQVFEIAVADVPASITAGA